MDVMAHDLRRVVQHQQWSTVTRKQLKTVEHWASSLDRKGQISLLQTGYEPQSGAIFGILKQMKEDMETSLAKARSEEETAVADFEALKAAKTQEIADAEDLVETKSSELAQAEEKKAQAKIDLEATEATLAADNKYLADLKVRCTNMDAEYKERTTARQLEMEAVSKALEFLSSDEAHDLFTRTFNPALLQTRAFSQRREAVARLLHKAAVQTRDPRLSAIAVQARLDAFEEVKKTITDMINKLMKETQDDIKHKDYCIDEFNANEVDTANKNREKEQKEAKIDELHHTIDTLDEEIVTLKAEVEELQLNQKQASIARAKMNKEFIATVSDQQATQQLLSQALKVLSTFYNKAALVQESAQEATSSKQPPPPGFKKLNKSAASGGVMGMMQSIIDEAKELEAEAHRNEEEAQADFEEFTKDTTQSIADKTKEGVHKAEEKGQREGDRIQKEDERDTAVQELEELAQVNKDLHNSCDFLLKNFGPRGEARDGMGREGDR